MNCKHIGITNQLHGTCMWAVQKPCWPKAAKNAMTSKLTSLKASVSAWPLIWACICMLETCTVSLCRHTMSSVQLSWQREHSYVRLGISCCWPSGSDIAWPAVNCCDKARRMPGTKGHRTKLRLLPTLECWWLSTSTLLHVQQHVTAGRYVSHTL